MNLTLSLIAGLVLLLPGLSALAAWNYKGTLDGAPGPDVPLTSVNGLFVVLGISAILHLVGYGFTTLIWAAAPILSQQVAHVTPPAIDQPYATLWKLFTEGGKVPSQAAPAISPPIEDVAELGVMIALLCAFAVRVASSRLLDVVFDNRDMRSLGWVHQNIIRPRRHGYIPFAYVLTSPTQGEFGVGYQGVVADVRQGPDGQVRTLCLSEPEVFVYEISGAHKQPGRKIAPAARTARVRLHPRRWLGGVVALEASVIRNVVVYHFPTDWLVELDDLDDEIEGAADVDPAEAGEDGIDGGAPA